MTLEAVGIFIGVATLLFGILDSRRIHSQALKQQSLIAILSISETFRSHWETGWSEILDQIDALPNTGESLDISAHQAKELRFMLNWVDWLGALSNSGAVDDLSIFTSSLGVTLKRIINCGRPIIEHDTECHGLDYWKNLNVVARHLNLAWLINLQKPQ